MLLEVQGRILPFWKPLINIFKKPDCHGCFSALNISQVMLKIVFLLVSYYKLLNTNAQDCKKVSKYFKFQIFMSVELLSSVNSQCAPCISNLDKKVRC